MQYHNPEVGDEAALSRFPSWVGSRGSARDLEANRGETNLTWCSDEATLSPVMTTAMRIDARIMGPMSR
jgi:hypothetical protein